MNNQRKIKIEKNHMKYKHMAILTLFMTVLLLCSLSTISAANNTITDSDVADIQEIIDVGTGDNINDISSNDNDSTPSSNGVKSTSGIGITPTGGEITPFAIGDEVNLNITKTATPSTTNVGGIVTYTVTVTNDGTETAHNVWVEETLGQYVRLSSYSTDNGTFNQTSSIWNIGDLASGESATMYLYVFANRSGNHNSVATVYSDESNVLSNSSNATFNAATSIISVNKEVSTEIALNGEEISFIITITNLGTSTFYGLSAIDILPSGLNYVGYTSNRGSYNSTTGYWGIGDLSANSTAVLVIRCKINGTGEMVNEVVVSSNDPRNDPDYGYGPFNPFIIHNQVGFLVLPATTFTVTKTVNATTSLNGEYLTYVVTIHNGGPNNATGIIVNETLDSRLVLLSYIASLGTYNNVTGEWTMDQLNIGQTATLTLYVQINGTGLIYNNVTVSSNENNTGDNNRSVNTTVLPAVNLSVNKTVNATTALVGDELTYVITITNNGPNNATDVNVTDILDSRLVLLSNSNVTTQGYYDPSTGLWAIGNISSGNTVTLTIRVSINGKGVIYNTATVSVVENNTGNTSSTVQTNVPANVNVSVTKTVDATTAFVGEYLTYVITVTNNGPDTASIVTVTDLLDSRLIIQSITPSTGSYNSENGVWTINDLTNSSSANLTIIVQINGTGTINNNGTVNTSDINTGNEIYAEVETNVTAAVNITVTKTVNATTALNHDELTYIITVINNGPSNANNVNVTDILDSRLVLLSNDTTQGYYDPSTGLWVIENISSGNTVTLTVHVSINGTGLIKNNATVYTIENNFGNNFSEVETNVPGFVSITVNKTVNATTAINGEYLTYVITIRNNGPDDASDVFLNDTLDSRLIFGSATPSIGIYNSTSGIWTLGSLAVDQEETLTIIVRINGTGTILNSAIVSLAESNTGNNSSTVQTEVNPAVNLTVTKIVNGVNSNTAINGEMLTYSITITNNGPDTAMDVYANDILDSKLIYIDIGPTSDGAYNQYSGVWMAGNIDSDSSVTLVLYVKINGTGLIKNNVTVFTTETNVGENFSEVQTDVSPLVNVTVVKSVNATNALNRDTLTYIITVTNNGPDNATNITVIDHLDSRLIIQSITPSIGNYNPTNGIWTIGTLNNDNSATLTITVQINGIGTINNNATVTTNEVNIGNNSTTVQTEVNPLVNVTVVKSVNATNALNRDTLTYIITVTNNGPDNATNITVIDHLDSRLIIQSITPSIGNYNPTNGIWTIGTLNNDNSATLTITVQINGIGTIDNNATVTTNEVNTGNNTTTVQTEVNPLVNVTVTKTVNSDTGLTGNKVTYTINVYNNGPDNATNVAVIDRLDSKLSYITSTATKGTYDNVTGLWDIGTLGYNKTETLIIVALITETGTITNTANVTTQEVNFGVNESTVSFYVKSKTNSTIIVPENIKIKQDIVISGVLHDENGEIVANAALTVAVGSKTYKVTTNSIGGWKISYTPTTSENINIAVRWEGNSVYVGFTNITKFNVGKLKTNTTIITPENIKVGKTIQDNNSTEGNNKIKTGNSIVSSKLSMKETGVPIIAILIVLIAGLVSITFRRKQK